MCACRDAAATNTSYTNHNPRRRFLSCACKNDPNKDGGCQDILHHCVDQMVQYCNNASTQAFVEALTVLRQRFCYYYYTMF
uniref:Uncharacterized protein n=1 Tax=Leersia perrieri TaxID=77586 RepID=A0A0D9XBW1_9ORYZ